MQRDEIIRVSRQLSGDNVCAELLALSIVEFSRTRETRLALDIVDSKGVLRDTGRGMRLTPDRGDTLSHAKRALTGHYPCISSNSAVDSVLHDLIWGDRGSLGPSLANLACSSYRFTSMRDREIWSQRYLCGQPTGPATMQGYTKETGTQIEFETVSSINQVKVKLRVQTLCERVHGLFISLRQV
jgi:DNA gyrase/topoisomerase IV subunit B